MAETTRADVVAKALKWAQAAEERDFAFSGPSTEAQRAQVTAAREMATAWATIAALLPEGPPPPRCPYDYHDMTDEERLGVPCMCQPHGAGGAYGCPEGCPTHNPGGEDVREDAIGGRDTDSDEELGQLREQLAVLRDLVGDLADPDPCHYDHHGYCQAHGWFATEPVCPMARAVELGLIPDDKEDGRG